MLSYDDEDDVNAIADQEEQSPIRSSETTSKLTLDEEDTVHTTSISN